METKNAKLPQFNFSEVFYIWFNPEAKEEYYSTPMYLYKTNTYNDMDNNRRKIIQENDFCKHKPSKKESAPKHPTSIYVPYYEQLGLFLISLLNADFSSFDSAYDTFFYLYGFELLKEYIPDKELVNTYSDKYLKYGNQSVKKLTKELDYNDSFIPMNNVYTSEKLSNIVFVVLEQLVKNSNLPIKSCQYCGRYFIPSVRQDELYCDLPSEDGKK